MTKGGTNTHKDVIYIDVDDEITGVIDKVRDSEHKIVALVLPKRATVLQSIVNMKLLKRTADETKKNIVLITSEASLMPLAGNVGLHVAKSLSSKPEIPDAPQHDDSKTETIEETSDDEDMLVDKARSVGELAGAAAVDQELDDTIELGDEDENSDETSDTKQGRTKQKKDKKFKIPNFNKFRLMLLLAALGVIALVSFAYAAIAVMPRAKVTIKTDSSAINSSVVATLKTPADTKLDVAAGIIPAQAQEVKKTLTQDVPATGQQNNGEKAGGTVEIKNCTDNPITIPAGTGVSASGLTFITQKSLSLDSGNFYSGGLCKPTGTHVKSVDVKAQSGGAKYNIAAQSYTVAGYGSSVTGSGSAMTGGTDNITKVVTKADVDGATTKIGQQDTQPIQQELKSALVGRDLFAIEASFNVGTPETKLSAEVGAAAETVTVTQTITYTMLGVKEDDLKKLIENDAKKKIDTKKQGIISYGLNDAVFSLQSMNPDGASVTVQTTVIAGAELDLDTIKKQIAGKKAHDAKEIIMANPGVTDVKVAYSPFWVSSIPSKTSKITIVVEEPQVRSEHASTE